MSSEKWNALLFGLVLMLSTFAAAQGQHVGQQVLNFTEPVSIKTERANKFTAACAHRDLLVTTLIDRHGEDQDVVGDELREASLIVMDARVTCARGREHEALALYDSILRISVPARATR